MQKRGRESYSLILLVMLAASPAVNARERPVSISLRENVQVHQRIVTVGDIADLQGGNVELRDRLARLDLAELTKDRRETTISGRRVEYRIRFAGIPVEMFELAGEQQVVVSYEARRLDASEVAQSARKALIQKLPWSEEQVVVELAGPVLTVLPEVGEGEKVDIQSDLAAGSRPPGRVKMDVRILVDGKHRLGLAVYFKVMLKHRVAVCLKRTEAGEAIQPAGIWFDLRPVDASAAQTLNPEAIPGKVARRTLMPGQIILAHDVMPAASPDAVVLIRVNQGVKLKVRSGTLEVTATGIAQQNGRKGELIRVQNISSKKIVLGRVIEAGMVGVE